MTADSIDAPPLTDLMKQVVTLLAELPAERQDELAQMLLDVAEGEFSDLRLSEAQLAEVDAALAEDGPYVSAGEMKAFFAHYRL